MLTPAGLAAHQKEAGSSALSMIASARKPLSEVLPPLILGTATFNVQYHPDPTRMPYTEIVRRALQHGITGFDTSPYYGPSEILLGDALQQVTPPPARDDVFLITKCGRIKSAEFDYSPAWVRYSICRSLERLGTTYLDLVYMHDVEFVSAEEVLGAVRELRALRDRGLIRYVGISGYPVDLLASLAEMVLRETGEPLDAVLSYSNYNIQNTRLAREENLARFAAARVECLLNASMLSMGLLKSHGGVDETPMGAWHPAPAELRSACAKLADLTGDAKLEQIALRWALQSWANVGSVFGTSVGAADGTKMGASVMGVAAVEELEETWKLWKSIFREKNDGLTNEIEALVMGPMWKSLGDFKDQVWESGGSTFVNERGAARGTFPDDDISRRWGLVGGLDMKMEAKI